MEYQLEQAKLNDYPRTTAITQMKGEAGKITNLRKDKKIHLI
jgi:hypothetical protein